MFWSFCKKVPILLPLDLNHYVVRDHDGSAFASRERTTDKTVSIYFSKPRVFLHPDIQQILLIGNIPFSLTFVHCEYKNYGCGIQKSYVDNHSWAAVSNVLARKLVQDSYPSLMVRRKDFIKVNSMLEDFSKIKGTSS